VLRVRVLINDPCGLTCKRLQEIMPRLGQKYDLDVETMAKSREEYQSEAYRSLGLPPAPAVMVEDEMAGHGPEISEERVEAVIRRQLELPPLEP